MMDVYRRFNNVMDEIVKEWKEKDNVEGVYVYGALPRGTLTANSTLDLCVIWNEEEAPVQLLAEHNNVRVDMTFLTPMQIEGVLNGEVTDAFKIAEVIERLREAKVVFDRQKRLKEWQERVKEYKWPEKVIQSVKERAIHLLDEASKSEMREDIVDAIELTRNALFDLGRVIIMRNNQFDIIRPTDVLTEVRMLDPITYQLFLRTFKLRGMEEEEIMDVLEDLNHWLGVTEDRLADSEVAETEAIELLSHAQRGYHRARELTIEGDYELAVLELRRSLHNLGKALLALQGIRTHDLTILVSGLRENEPEYFDQIFEEYGGFDFQIKGVNRSIAEARFIAQRI
ncbi:MAG: nucleotidyltransferase domain-containing protein [Candidatus Thorarchaeota archaeon]